MKTVLVAGATGYLGKYLVAAFREQGWRVRALVRDLVRAQALGLEANEYVTAEATDSKTLRGIMTGTDLLVSSLGITRQRDGLTYRAVDYQANLNLLEEALSAGVSRFAYVHVLGAKEMLDVPLVAAKHAFVERLQAAPIASTVIAPSGYFSDMADFLAMARTGRVWLFGSGQHRLNPIHGSDLANAVARAVEGEERWLDVGGPDVFTHEELAELAFEALGKPAKITHLPDFLRRTTAKVLPRVTPLSVHGPVLFFLTAMGMDMNAAASGTHHLADYFKEIAEDKTS